MSSMSAKWTGLVLAAALAAGLWGGQAWGATIESAGSGLWTNGASWVGGVAPGIDDEAVITNGCTVTMNDLVTRSVSNLTIQAGGVLTHTDHGSGDSSEKYKVVFQVVSNLTIEAGGAINVDGKGYYRLTGPNSPNLERAASHGGLGAYATDSRTYGSPVAPTNIGKGSRVGDGGGAVVLAVTGHSAVNGTISASGSSGGDYPGPAGGSVFLTTGTLSGSGTLRAEGGTGYWYSGGGGRIAVVLTGGDSFDGVKFRAFGGPSVATTRETGGAGTLYLQTATQGAGKGTLVIDNNDMAPATGIPATTEIPAGQTWDTNIFAVLVVTNKALVGVRTNATLDLTGMVLADDKSDTTEGFYLNGGTLVPNDTPYAFAYRLWLAEAAAFDPGRSVIVQSNGIFQVDASNTLSGSLTVQTGGMLTHRANSSTEAWKLVLNITGDLTIEAGGLVDVTGKGYAQGQGPYCPSGNAMGASHGGQGANLTDGPTYGSIVAPSSIGTGSKHGGGAPGGGVVRLTVAGDCLVNGTIAADGPTCNEAGPSGGSVYLCAATLGGSGTIRADGGRGYSYGGGGGRVAVILTNGTSFGSAVIQAMSGSDRNNTGGYAAPGSVYLQTRDQATGEGLLLVDAMNRVSAGTTLIGSNITDTAVGTTIITNKAVLAVSNQTLTVRGDWLNTAAFTSQTNSTVNFAGTQAASIQANNTFFNLTCTNAGKTLSFEAGRTNTVNALLKLGATGGDPPVTLQSTTPGSQWYLTLSTNGGIQQIGKVSVKDSNASPGQQIIAGAGSRKMGNNVHWWFPPTGMLFMIY